jgi:NADH-quinone oxidoreductase subunit L
MVTSIVLVAVGIGAGWAIYGRRPRADAAAADPIEKRFPGVFAALGARLGFDELYAATAFKANAALAAFSDWTDRYVWDGAVRLLAGLGEFTGVVNRDTDEQGLNGGFNSAAESLRATGQAYSKAQTGSAHGYLRTLVLGFVIVLLVVIFGGAR